MRKEDRIILKQFAKRMRENYPEAQIWAFGSRTRDDATRESDLDVCVVLKSIDFKKRREISHIAWDIGFENDLIISTIVFSEEMFKSGPFSASTLVKSIVEEGVAA